jgi:hypothetical protein
LSGRRVETPAPGACRWLHPPKATDCIARERTEKDLYMAKVMEGRKIVMIEMPVELVARYAVMMLREAKTLEPPPPFVMPRRTGGGWMAS